MFHRRRGGVSLIFHAYWVGLDPRTSPRYGFSALYIGYHLGVADAIHHHLDRRGPCVGFFFYVDQQKSNAIDVDDVRLAPAVSLSSLVEYFPAEAKRVKRKRPFPCARVKKIQAEPPLPNCVHRWRYSFDRSHHKLAANPSIRTASFLLTAHAFQGDS